MGAQPFWYYFTPQIRDVSVIRCDADGTESVNGTCIRISATRLSCFDYIGNDGDWISCIIRYRYRPLKSAVYSDWVTIPEESGDSHEGVVDYDPSWGSVDTGALDLGLSADEDYEVVVGVLDSRGNSGNTSVILHSGNVFMHKDGEKNAISIGEAVGETEADRNRVTIAEKLTTFIKGLLKTKNIQCDGTLTVGGTTLKEYSVNLSGFNYGNVKITLPDTYEEHFEVSIPVEASLSHSRVGGISASCTPNAYESGDVRIQMNNSFKGTSLDFWLYDDMVAINGLTEPLGPDWAANKQYVDDQIQMIKDKLGL